MHDELTLGCVGFRACVFGISLLFIGKIFLKLVPSITRLFFMCLNFSKIYITKLSSYYNTSFAFLLFFASVIFFTYLVLKGESKG